MPDKRNYVPTYEENYTPTLTELEIIWKDKKKSTRYAKLANPVKGTSMHLFLLAILENIIGGDHRTVFPLPENRPETIDRTKIKKIELTFAE